MDPLLRRLTEARSAGGVGLSIVVVRLGALGDVVRSIPAVRLVRAAFPAARLTWVVESRWAAALDRHPDLDGLVTLPRGEWDADLAQPRRWPALAAAVRSFRARLRSTDADLTLDFHGNLRSGLCTWWTGAPFRVGYDGHQQKEGNHWFSTHRVASGIRRTPRIERNLSLVRAIGIETTALPGGALALVDAGRAAADAILVGATGRELAIVCPGVSRAQAYKKPPTALLAAGVERLAARGLDPLVVWGPGEEDDARAVVEASGRVARLAPPTDLAALAALLDRARLYVGGDTGPMHLACATGCPVIGLYGPTDPLVNRPWGVPFRAVAPPGRIYVGIPRLDRRGGRFEGVTPAHVVRAVDSLLDETEPLAR